MALIPLIILIVSCFFIFRRSQRKLRTALYMLLGIIITVPVVGYMAVFAGMRAADAGAVSVAPAFLVAALIGLIHSRRSALPPTNP